MSHNSNAIELSSIFAATYNRLIDSKSSYDEFDKDMLASIIASAVATSNKPLTESLGLSREMLDEILTTVFANAYTIDELTSASDTIGKDAIEEEEFRAFFIENGTNKTRIEVWLAYILVRRILEPHHLWQALGVRSRQVLSDTLYKHFEPLASKNTQGMRWKKFFYREMCQKVVGNIVCKSPICDVCPDYKECFAPED